MITTEVPSTWQNLQNSVGQILRECGFDVEVEKVVSSVRGNVEIDVYAEEEVQGRAYRIICECKHWRSRVPQQIIHGFRTVTADVGAHKGYIISSNGFQSGSFSAAELTNIELMTWEEFQTAFEPTWLERYFSPTITDELDPLMTYTEPLAPKWFPNLPEPDRDAFMELKNYYDEIGWLAMSLSTYSRLLRKEPFPELPLLGFPGASEEKTRLPQEILRALGYRELLAHMLKIGREGIGEFREIRDRNGFEGGE